MLMGPTSGWSDTNEYHLLSQLQLPFANNIIACVLSKCENLVGVMVFGRKAYDNILPWLRTHFSQKFLIQNVFLNHPLNIKWRYTLEHAQNYIETLDCWVIHHPPLDVHGAGGRERRPWPCQRAPSSGRATEGLSAVIEAMAGGAQDDDFFLTISCHGGLLGYTPPPARFSWHRR